MTVQLSKKLTNALNADEPGALAEIVASRRTRDVDALRMIARNDDGSYDDAMQRKALSAIGRMGDPSDGPMLIEVLPRLADDRLRVAAIDALGRLGSPAAVEALATYLDDSSPQIRKTVVIALDRARTPRARELLADLAAGTRGDALTQERARVLDRLR